MQDQHDCAKIGFITIVALALLMANVACGGNAKASGESAGPGGPGGGGLPVQVQTVKAKQVADSTEYLATLQSRNSAIIQPQVGGYVTQIFVHSGDHVSAGTKLMQIDPEKQQATVRNERANLNAKLANLDYAKTQLERQKQLYAAGVISKQAFDQAQTAYDAAKADVAASRASIREQEVQLHYYTVRAPDSGVIGDIPVKVGDSVTTQTTLTTLDKGGKLEAYIQVPTDHASDLHVGMPVELFTEGTQPVRTRVSFVSPRVNTQDQTVLVKADVPNLDRFRNAQVVRARVIWKEMKAPVVPVTAVTRLGGQAFAFVVEKENGKDVAREKPVELGEIVGNDYVVKNGIQPGDRLITSGVQILTNGMPVTPKS